MSIFDKFRSPDAIAKHKQSRNDRELLVRAERDLDELTPKELQRVKLLYEADAARQNAELVRLQTQNARADLRGNIRAALVEQYLEKIEELNLKTPGGIRSVAPEEGENEELVMEAWRIFCARRRGGGSRFG